MPSAPQDAELPKPKDLSHLLSKSTRNRAASSIKAFYKYFSIPGIGQLAGGLPNPSYFPFDTLEAHAALPDRHRPTPNEPVDPPNGHSTSLPLGKAESSEPLKSSSSLVIVPKDSNIADRARKIDLASALQYGTAEGYPPLRTFLRHFTREHMHPSPAYVGGPEIILTCGSTDGFDKFLKAFNNEWVLGRDALTEKEGLLVEEFAYMNAVQAAQPRGVNIVPVAIDDEGMCAFGPDGLEEVLSNWNFLRGKRPHMMYTVTIGQNPTSGVLSLARRREIYKLCRDYDIVICEDDPYWYLQYPSANPAKGRKAEPGPEVRQRSSGYNFLDSLVPSYISIDTDGRVIRLDTFSKTIAPGCRMGWITAQGPLAERLLRLTETSTQQPSGFAQSLVAELLLGPQSASDPGRGGGASHTGYQTAGWVRWLEGLRGNYERRMNTMCEVLDAGKCHVKTGRRPSLKGDGTREKVEEWSVIEQGPQMYRFNWPMGGMFLWLEVVFESHPLADRFEGGQLSQALWVLWTRKPFRVLVSPGWVFAPTEAVKRAKAWRFFRLCFAACEEVDVRGLSERVVEGVRGFWRIRDPRVVDELLDDANDEKVLEGLAENVEGMSLAGFGGC